MLATRAADASIPVVYANLVGGQDELVFDGGSLVIDAQGELVARAKQFTEDLLVVDLDVRAAFRKRLLDPRGRARSTPLPEVLVSEARLGVAPRSPHASSRCSHPCARSTKPSCSARATTCARTGSPTSTSRLSGGVDSAIVATIAVDALGAEHVTGVLMPSRFSSDHSITDAEALAANLGIATLHGADRARARGVRGDAEPTCSRAAPPGARRGERAVAYPRQRDDDDLQQARFARAHHRQQERDGHRLRDALRRHGRAASR